MFFVVVYHAVFGREPAATTKALASVVVVVDKLVRDIIPSWFAVVHLVVF
jgi:hypothetical protein